MACTFDAADPGDVETDLLLGAVVPAPRNDDLADVALYFPWRILIDDGEILLKSLQFLKTILSLRDFLGVFESYRPNNEMSWSNCCNELLSILELGLAIPFLLSFQHGF